MEEQYYGWLSRRTNKHNNGVGGIAIYLHNASGKLNYVNEKIFIRPVEFIHLHLNFLCQSQNITWPKQPVILFQGDLSFRCHF